MKDNTKNKITYGALILLAGTLFVFFFDGSAVTFFRYFFPKTVTIIVPDGYRGPIAVLQAEDQNAQGARDPYEIVVPPNGIARSWIPGIVPRLPQEYYLEAKYQNGETIPISGYNEFYDPSRVECDFGGVLRYSTKSDSRGRPIFDYTIVSGFVGTETQRAKFQYTEWFLRTIKETPYAVDQQWRRTNGTFIIHLEEPHVKLFNQQSQLVPEP